MDEKMLTLKQESEIKEKAQKIKEEKKLRKIYPMVVFGEEVPRASMRRRLPRHARRRLSVMHPRQ